MVNKDYILRIAERFGRSLAIILGLRKLNKQEEALIYIDDVMQQMLGLTSTFLNSLSEDMLIKTFSPMGVLNADACLWAASLLKAEGDVYEDMGKSSESYYRYLKSLHLFLTVLLQLPIESDSDFSLAAENLIDKLEEYELPNATKSKLFAYYEHIGQYGKAEDTLYELLESDQTNRELIEQGRDFYTRLLKKSDHELTEGNLAREEAEEGLAQLRKPR
ncbi:MAG TPA: DUF6483 family protein [Ktedonosporobacter sp.]|nr:DUF6483 family protein [Ktedonosporobacter sp.]